MTRWSTYWVALLLALTSCGGRRIDLGRDADHEFWGAKGGNANSTVILYEGSSRVVDFAVDEQRLYVVTDGSSVLLRSCALDACESTLQTLARFVSDDPVYVLSGGGLLLSSEELFFDTSTTKDQVVWACPVTGCPSGPRLVTGHGIGGPFTADQRDLYFTTDTSLWACSRSGCESPREVYRGSGNDPRFAVRNPELNSGDQFVYFWNEGSVWRTDRTFGGKEEIVFESQNEIGGIAWSPDGLYVADSILAGRLIRCEPGECDTTRSVVVSGQRYPANITVNERNIDWVSGTRAFSIVSCPREDCTRPRVIATADPNSMLRYRDNAKSVVWHEHLGDEHDRIQMVSLWP